MCIGILLTISAVLAVVPAFAQGTPEGGDAVTVGAKWDSIVRVSETVPTTQHLANAFTLRSSPLNKPLLKALKDLHTNDTRLQLWFSVPNQAVTELQEPTPTETFWDFKYIDPVVVDFFANTSGVHHLNIGTIPRWMFNVPPIELPRDPAATSYAYTKGTTGDLLKDPTGKQFAEFQARLFQWYTQGGFTDEIGKYHKSGYHFKIDYWGVLNEPSLENHISVEEYTKIYDAVAEAIHKIDSHVEFMGPEIVGAPFLLPFTRYFLNPKNHSPSAPPLDWFSFNNYVMGTNDPATWQGKFFTDPLGEKDFGAPALAFADQLREVIKLRDELSPKAKISIDELGTFDALEPMNMADPDGPSIVNTKAPYSAYNSLYWVASGGNWAANFINAEILGIQLISMTQMVGAPTQSESCSMINWDTAHPNAHYWVLSLINSNFGPGDKLVGTQSSSRDVIAQASITKVGRKVLLVNTSNNAVSVNLADAFQGSSLKVEVVDQASGEQAPRKERVTGPRVNLAPFAVAVVATGGK
jgi:hypothetical protein